MENNRKNIIALCIFSYGIIAFWTVENFWINLYWTRNVNPNVRYVGFMVAVSAIVGVFTHIIFGALSDSCTSKHGRRRPFILFGSITGGIAMCLFPITRLFSVLMFAVTYAIIMDALITFFGDTTTPTRMAFLADSTKVERRGRINALVGFCGGLGIFSVIILSGYIFDIAGPDFVFYFSGVILMICGIFFFIISKDPPVNEAKTFRENLKETFTLDSYRENKSFYILLFFLFINSTGIQIVFPYLFIYIESIFGLKGVELALLIGVFTLIGFLISILVGFLLDKIGRKAVMLLFTTGGSITAFIFAFISPNQGNFLILILLLGGLMMGCFSSIGATSETWMQDLAPEDRRGSLLGYRIAALVIPHVPGALIGGFLADFGPKPEGFIYSPIIFIVCGIVLLLSVPFLKKVEETLKKENLTSKN
jgi:MFS family permease